MNTKKSIAEKSRLLFNQKGVMNVTLRDVAQALEKSYGNVTYHFRTKEDILIFLFEQMNMELTQLLEKDTAINPLEYVFELPRLNYKITFQYLFFTIDYKELQRNYPIFFQQVNQLNMQRKHKWKAHLTELCKSGYLNPKLNENDIEYLIFLSVSVRMTYFLLRERSEYNEQEFVYLVNSLILPYLSETGLHIYTSWLNKIEKPKH
jgi:AcrR family transcriptional regulator